MKKITIIFILLLSFAGNAQDEVVYHVFQRSFFDSDGDRHGDLNGIRQKLDYLQELGVNTILLTPLYASDFYHNYFSHDFEAIDPEYGTTADYALLVKEVHKRKMKIYQDVEMQYVTGTHPWFKDSFGNPASPSSDYVLYSDKENKNAYPFWGIPEFTLYDGRKQQIYTANMKSQKLKDYTVKVLSHWVDPNQDGKFSDGVDGFRLDHMMDKLDNIPVLDNLFAEFWTPVLTTLRDINPKLKIVAEQANWGSYAHDYMTKGNVDYVFAFRLKFAVDKFNKEEIEKAADSTFHYNPSGKSQLVFLENHDTGRFASEKGMTSGKSKAAVALQLLMGGIPSIYYGQEIGMKGKQQSYGMTDGNDIGVREAFEWYADGNGEGMAHWYENSGPWWDNRNEKPNDGISLEEQRNDPNSLFNWYKKLLELRKKERVLQTGSYVPISNDNRNVISFVRSDGKKKVLVIVNLSGETQSAKLSGQALTGKNLLRTGYFFKTAYSVNVDPFEVVVARL